MEAAPRPALSSPAVGDLRSRGRGRARGRVKHDGVVGEGGSNPGSPGGPGLGKTGPRAGCPGPDDAVASVTLSDRHREKKTNGQTSDKENSPSPRVQRSRRSVFDSRVMSRINTHLQQSAGLRSDAVGTRSLDRLKKLSPPGSARSVCRASPGSQPESAAARDKGPVSLDNGPVSHDNGPVSQDRGLVSSFLLIEGRARSMTDPLPPSHWAPSVTTGVMTAGVSSMTTSTPASHTPLSPLQFSSSVSSKARGRGRGRGRARAKKLEMESPQFPGTVADLEPQGSQPLVQDQDRFTDAESDTSVAIDCGATSHTEGDLPVAAGVEGPVCSSPHQVSPPASPPPGAAPSEQGDKPDRERAAGLGGLSLKIDVGEAGCRDDQGMLYSPLADDITLLLSPDHQYTLDWAAAMASPTPDASADTPPDWSLARASPTH